MSPLTFSAHTSSNPGRRALGAAGIAFAIISSQVAGKATRDAYFLDTFSSQSLPLAMTASSVMAVVVALLVARLLAAWSPGRTTPLVFAVQASLFAAEAVLSWTSPALAAGLVYLHTAALGGASISAFWSLMNERFDPHEAKRLFSRIGAGATAGGIVGGLLSWHVARFAPVEAMLPLLAGINGVCALSLGWWSRGHHRPSVQVPANPAQGAPNKASLQVQRSFLLCLAALVALAAFADVWTDFVFKAEVARRFSGGPKLAFFSLFYAATGTATFLVQAVVSPLVLRHAGLATAMAVLPGGSVVMALVGVVVPGFWPAAALRATSLTSEHSLFRSGYELAYTPLSPEQKRPIKTLVDIGSNKVAAALAGLVTMGAVAWLPGSWLRPVAFVMVSVSGAAAFLLTRALQRGYVKALALSLRDGVIGAADVDLRERNTLTTLTGTSGVSRRALLDAIAMEGARRGRNWFPRPVTAYKRLSPDLVPGALAALAEASPEVAASLLLVLRRQVDAVAGQLVDVLLDPATPATHVAAAARILQAATGSRTVAGLTEALFASRKVARHQAARTLLAIVDKQPDLQLDHARLLEAARVELVALTYKTAKAAGTQARPIAHLTTLLALAQKQEDREPMQLAFRALNSSDPSLQGTALEYLEHVLPQDFRRSLDSGLLNPHTAPRPRSNKPARELAEDLLRSRNDLRRPALAPGDDSDAAWAAPTTAGSIKRAHLGGPW